MSRREKRTRIILVGLYFIITYGILVYYTYDDSFCSSSRTGQSRIAVTARLALACTVWAIFASICAAGALAATKKYFHWTGIAPLVGMLVAGLGFAYLPIWINEGSGRQLYRTWADVSCFFTEGNGVAFPFVVAPALAIATLVCEIFIVKEQKQRAAL